MFESGVVYRVAAEGDGWKKQACWHLEDGWTACGEKERVSRLDEHNKTWEWRERTLGKIKDFREIFWDVFHLHNSLYKPIPFYSYSWSFEFFLFHVLFLSRSLMKQFLSVQRVAQILGLLCERYIFFNGLWFFHDFARILMVLPSSASLQELWWYFLWQVHIW